MRLFALCRAGLAALAVTAAIGAAPAAAQQTGVRFSLEGRLEGPAALFVLTRDKGYFSAEQLSVVIEPAASALDPITRIASGAADMAIADINLLIDYRDQNPKQPIPAVFMVYNKPPYAVVGRKSRGISGPKSLEGKRIGAPLGVPTAARWPLFAKITDLDTSKIALDKIAPALRAPMLAAGQLDAILGYSFITYINLKDRGVPADDIVLLPMADHGLVLYGSAIIVNPKFLAEKPEAVRGFLRAFTKGLKDAVRAPAQAAEGVVDRNGLTSSAVEGDRLRMAIEENIVTPEVRRLGYGAIDPARLALSIEQMGLVQTFKTKPVAGDIFDPSYLPAPALRQVD